MLFLSDYLQRIGLFFTLFCKEFKLKLVTEFFFMCRFIAYFFVHGTEWNWVSYFVFCNMKVMDVKTVKTHIEYSFH